MAEDKESTDNWIVELAEIVDKIDNTFLVGEKTDILVELSQEKFQTLETYFRTMDKGTNKKIVSISGVNFTFVLKK